MKSQGQDFLSSEDTMAGFSTATDSRNSVSLLQWGKPVAWFSAMLDEKTVKAFVELIKARKERQECLSDFVVLGNKRRCPMKGVQKIKSFFKRGQGKAKPEVQNRRKEER